MERNSFLMVAKEMLADKRISATEKLLLAQLLDHRNKRTDQCNPRQTTLARELGISRHTVERALWKLRELGFLTIKRGQSGYRYEFPSCQNGNSELPKWQVPSCQNGNSDVPSPLYEPYLKEPGGARAASSSNKKSLNAPAPPRKSAQSETLDAYYREEERRKAGK